jgi:hypothetical protein
MLPFCGFVFSGGETEISQKFSSQRISSPKIILENLNRRPVSNEEYHCNAPGTNSVPSKTHETCKLNDINGFLQNNNNGRPETLFLAKRIRCRSLQRQMKQKPCIKTCSESNWVDPVLGALQAALIYGLYSYHYMCLCDTYSKDGNGLFFRRFQAYVPAYTAIRSGKTSSQAI